MRRGQHKFGWSVLPREVEIGIFGRLDGKACIAARRGAACCAVAALSFSSAGLAIAGPCTAQIVALERQVAQMPPGQATGPTFTQTLGAQLHHQPTPRDVEHAEDVAKKQAKAALGKARQADAEGNAEACNDALRQARGLYGLDK